MEINFETKTVRAFHESARLIKRTQLSMESVVPDINDDIGRLYSVQPSVLLKSKDVTARGAAVTGELAVALLYINELENAVFDLHFTQSFSLDFDLPDPDPDTQTQIRLFVSNAEARALNPRKVSVTVEVGGELSTYAEEESRIAVCLPRSDGEQIYTKEERVQSALINAVCEKTFVVNEQFPFTAGMCAPDRLLAQKVDFRLADRQLIGSKILLKGNVCVSVCYMTVDTALPVSAEFSAPFSQLIEIGQEQMDVCSIRIEPTSLYFDLIDTISGEKAIDTEIHAVVQLVSRYRQEIDYLSDAYAARCPVSLAFESWSILTADAPERFLLESDEQFELPEDCEEIQSVIKTLGPCVLGQGKAECSLCFDILYRCSGGTLSSTKRLVQLSSECPVKEAVLRETRLLGGYERCEGNQLIEHVCVELIYERSKEQQISCAVGMTLDEERPYDASRLPTVTAVRVDRESVWDLAKRYHSSCAEIEALNETDGPIRGKMLLIPKCL